MLSNNVEWCVFRLTIRTEVMGDGVDRSCFLTMEW